MTITTIILAALLLFLALDWLQTLVIARNPLTRSEINPILGPHPSVAKVTIYFAICTMAVGAIFYFDFYAIQILGVALIVEVFTVVNNFKTGIRL